MTTMISSLKGKNGVTKDKVTYLSFHNHSRYFLLSPYYVSGTLLICVTCILIGFSKKALSISTIIETKRG